MTLLLIFVTKVFKIVTTKDNYYQEIIKFTLRMPSTGFGLGPIEKRHL